MKILVACEESQVVTNAFRLKGHEAYSCDLMPTSGHHPEWHIQADVCELLNQEWDMIIAFPPCTYMSKAGARWMYKGGVIDPERYNLSVAAKNLFLKIYNSNCQKICIENPVPLKIVGLPNPSCDIQPYEFGHNYSKKTYLWLKGLSPLLPTDLIINHVPYLPSNTGNKNKKVRHYGVAASQIDRSKTFTGIAYAMANQWG